jgi:putative sporulation protein YtxC
VINLILLSIGYSKNNRDINDRLNEMCRFFKNKGVSLGLIENDISNMHYVKCVLKDTESDIRKFENCREMFTTYSANVIYDFISKGYESEMLDKIVTEKYSYLEGEDIDEIRRRSMEVIDGTGVFTTQGLLYSISCRNNILKKLEEYLQENSEIILDGFITFRLKDINQELNNILDRIVEEYVIEKEYSEFVKLLKYFVEIQDSKYSLINIIIQPDGDYRIEDDKHNDITKEFFEDFSQERIKGEVNKHDILISALITSAPSRLVVHCIENTKNQDAIDTIKSIFLDKLTICSGCERCRPNLSQQK